MSSDNAYLVGQRGDKFFAVMIFMSDEDTDATDALTEADCKFNSFEEAVRFASEQYSEYGVYVEGPEE